VISLRNLALGTAAAFAVAGLAPALAQDEDLTAIPAIPEDYQPAKTPWGEPDFRGGWPIDHLNATPFQRTPEQGNRYYLTAEEFAQREQMFNRMQEGYEREEKSDSMGMGHWMEAGEANRRTSMLIAPANGRLPEKTAEGKRRSDLMRSSYRKGQTFDSPADFDSWDRCITRGLPASMFTINYNNGIRIFQSPGQVAIQLEMIHETRIVPTDGRAAVPRQIEHWMGESRGRWENGNTLVVTTTNFKPGPSATNVGTWGAPPENDSPVSTDASMVERFTMTGPDSIVYEVTWTDPVVYTAPWTARLDWRRNDDYKFYEYACHEGNVQLRGYVTSSRAERAGTTVGEQEDAQ